MSSRVAAVLLAAGRSTRYRAAGGTDPTKLVAAFRGEPLVRHAARAALAAGLAPVVAVTGQTPAAVERALAGLDVTLAHNAAFADGLATSLRCGLAAVPEDAPAAVVLLGDMPLVSPAVLRTLVAAFANADAVVPLWRGERGNPVLLGRGLFAAAAALTGDEGARRLLRDPSLRVVELDVEDEAVRLDVDEPADLARADPFRAVRP